jgi:predicted aconitase/predicted aconitase with swiveling domain
MLKGQRDISASTFTGRALVPGIASGTIIFSDVALSFWGGVDSQTGEVIDRHHPLSSQVIAGKILAIPGGRGSCTGSSVLMELIMNGHAPAGIIVSRQEEILSLGVIVADEVFGRSIPVVRLSEDNFAALRRFSEAGILGDKVILEGVASELSYAEPERREYGTSLSLTSRDVAVLNGAMGKATQVAMRVTARMAEIQGATELIDISQVHIDGCIYTGPTSLEFATRMRDWGGKVTVPTTLNSISVDQMRWREQGVAPTVAEPASELGETYASMGARKTFTCAPYQLQSAPKLGDQVVWAESNAVVYANSVLGARTAKYPDYLDLCIALTGRAPLTGAHISDNRRASIVVNVSSFNALDDMVYPLLGYHVGKLVGDEIPILIGLENWNPFPDDLKAFGAGFATTSSSPMFHIAGVTPEAMNLESVLGSEITGKYDVCPNDLLEIWDSLNNKATTGIELVAFGNPHFSFDECGKLASLCENKTRHSGVQVLVTCSRATFERASNAKLVEKLSDFGIQFVTDACWCTLAEPVIPKSVKTIITNSAKFAHYGPGLTGKALRLGSLADCVQAACDGRLDRVRPVWA